MTNCLPRNLFSWIFGPSVVYCCTLRFPKDVFSWRLGGSLLATSWGVSSRFGRQLPRVGSRLTKLNRQSSSQGGRPEFYGDLTSLRLKPLSFTFKILLHQERFS